ncbi:MAG TPA: hypothetical protein VH834_14700 [Solirubrobacteraceae bacterium]
MLAGTPILVSAAHGDHLAGVRRDAEGGHLWIAHWMADRPDRVAGTRLEGLEPARIGVPGWWIVGARLPDSVATVDVRGESGTWHGAAIANGAWVAFADGGDDVMGIPPIRLLDAHGELVSRVPASWIDAARALTEQETELLAKGQSDIGGPCPVCWTYDWRAAPAEGDASGERIFCARCGHNDGAVSGFYGG